MITEKELDAILLAWADEYGGGKYENIGYPSRSYLARLMECGHAPVTHGHVHSHRRTQSDDIEKIVSDMEGSGMYKQGKALRCEYFLARAPEEQKLQNLRAIGCGMSRAGFYQCLREAKAWMIAALSYRKAG